MTDHKQLHNIKAKDYPHYYPSQNTRDYNFLFTPTTFNNGISPTSRSASVMHYPLCLFFQTHSVLFQAHAAVTVLSVLGQTIGKLCDEIEIV